MGDSITEGIDYYTGISGGYRDPLMRDLNGAGISFTFVGAANTNPTAALTAAGNSYHNGYGNWKIGDLNNNLDGVANPVNGGDNNQGGYFLTGGHGTGRAAVSPDIILLHIGTNDILQGNANLTSDLYTLVTHIHALSPKTAILLAGIIPSNYPSIETQVVAYNLWIKGTLVPALSYTTFVDQNSPMLYANGTVNGNLLGTDYVHPDRYGYPIVGYTWAAAIEKYLGVNPAGYGLTMSNALNLTVNSGTTTGSYPAGSVLTIAANAPASGTQFASWSPATSALTNVYSTYTTYVMPAAASTLTAIDDTAGSPILANGTYQIVSLYDGLSVGAAAAADGSSVQQQTYAGASTQKWTLTNLGGNVVTLMLAGTHEALEVPSALASTVSAGLDVSTYTGAATQQWTVTPGYGVLQLVNAGSGQALVVNGYATYPGAQLGQYTLGGLTIEMWQFYPLAPAPAIVATYSLTVSNGTGSGVYTAGTAVPVTANAAASGYRFSAWSGAVAYLANPSSATTTLTMPAAASTITAVYVATTTSPTLPAFSTMSILATGASAAGASLQAAIADFNGDGYADLATTNTVDASVSVLLGKGTGAFQTAGNYATGNGPYGVVAGDFNGDGKPDLAIVNGLDNTVSILLNAAGAFPAKPSYTYSVGNQPFGISVADFNRDGSLDLVVTNNAADTVSVLLGNGDGSFQTAVSYATGNTPFGTAIADVNGDGYPDLIVWNYDDGTAGVLLNTGLGTFQPQSTYATGTDPYGVATGDFNGDGYPDLAVANLGSKTLSVLLNNKSGGFLAATGYATGALPSSVLAVDLNGDGVLDLATPNLGDGTVSVLLGKGDGTFLAQTAYAAGTQPYSLQAADFNGDGKPDLAVSNFFSPSIGVLLQIPNAVDIRITTSPHKVATMGAIH